VSRIAWLAALLVAHTAPGLAQPSRDAGAHRAVLAGGRHLDLSAGVGLEGFIGSEMRDVAGVGPAWSVRAALGNPQSVRVELVYQGSRQPVSFMADHGSLTGHGVQGLLHVNVYPEGLVEPYFVLGAGWSRFSISGRSGGSMLAAADDVFEMPIGFGFAYRWHQLVVDLRVGVRAVTAPNLLPSPTPTGSEDHAMMHRYGATLGIGYSL